MREIDYYRHGACICDRIGDCRSKNVAADEKNKSWGVCSVGKRQKKKHWKESERKSVEPELQLMVLTTLTHRFIE